MCFGHDRSSDGSSPRPPRPVHRVPLSIERTSRVAVPARARSPSRKRVDHSRGRSTQRSVHREPLSIERTSPVVVSARSPSPPWKPANHTPERPTQRPINTYKQPNPGTPEMVLEYDNYKAADVSSGAASSRYRRERERRVKDANPVNWTTGRQTFAPMKLTPDSHFELLPMAVDWEGKATTHHSLRKGFDEAHPRAYDSPRQKETHRKKAKDALRSAQLARSRVIEHDLYQWVTYVFVTTFNYNRGNFMQSDPYDYLDWATVGSSNLPNRRRIKGYDYDK